eukprot:4388152-Prorocentrum_lima.AAC.1
MGDDPVITLWGTDALAEEAGIELGNVVRLLRARRDGQRLMTARPLLHAAEAPLRSVTVVKDEQLYRLDFEDWSLQS